MRILFTAQILTFFILIQIIKMKKLRLKITDSLLRWLFPYPAAGKNLLAFLLLLFCFTLVSLDSTLVHLLCLYLCAGWHAGPA